MFYQTDINNNKKPSNSNQQQSVYLMFGDDEQHHSQNDLCSLENNQSKLKKNATLNKINQSSSAVVPNLTNVDEIFYLLSQKIAKYCQILSDLTNCEVFYKAYLPLNNTNKNELNTKSKKLNNNSKNNPSSSTISTTKQLRSLYWGTHQMLFQFSHDQGIKYNKQSGDSLIKLNNRSISTDINQLIEEILNAPSSSSVTNENNKEQTIESNNQIPKLINKELINKPQTNEIKLKDCCIYLNKLDDNENITIDHYFNKFELKHNNLETGFMIGQDIIDENNNNKALSLNELPSDSELYSDQYIINFNGKKSQHVNNNTDSEDENDDDDEDEKALLEKNCLNTNDINENDENYYRCEQCPSGYSYKHLTQLKVHQLRAHYNIDLNNKTCQKCNYSSGKFASQIEFLKHSITCYFPNAYQCKTCSQIYENYSQYLFHIRYIHTHVVYMCSICNRKYKHIKDLIDHDQLMHSKSLNYCEICFESFRSRKYLYEHYKKNHLNKQEKEKEILIINELDSDDNDDDNEDEDNDSIEHERIQKPNNQMITKEVQLDDNDNDDDDDECININDEDNEEEEEEEHFTDKSNKKSATSSQNQPKVHKNELIRGLIDRKHQCKWCSLRFYTKSQLKQHENLHTNSVLNCPVCDKQFTSKDRLNGHMKCHMEPSLECKVCGKKFKRLCNLYNHELVHGLTEHAFMLCQFCGRGFRSRRDYQNHVIANHRDHLMKVDSEGTVIQELNNNNNLKRTRKTSKKVSSSTNISNSSNSITNSTPSNENIQPSNDLIVNDSTDDTYFTRTGVNFDLEDFQFDDEDEFNHLDEEYNLNDKQSNSINKKSINNKNKIKKFKMNNQIEVEEDYMSDQSQPQQINQTKANTSILANLFEESLN